MLPSYNDDNLIIPIKLNDMSYMSYIRRKLANIHSRFNDYRNIVWPILRWKFTNRKSVFLIYTPTHGNLGDHAIAQAETIMLNSLGVKFYEIPGSTLYLLNDRKILYIFNNSTILINGGGYLGTLYKEDDNIIRKIIQTNKHSKILFFPNTLFFDDEKYLTDTANIFNRHKRLVLYVRESISYNKYKKWFLNIKLAPDVVLSMKKQNDASNRNGILLCLRHDFEKTRDSIEDDILQDFSRKHFGNDIELTDMYRDITIPLNRRNALLDNMYNLFLSKELVITDRLHGAIFSVITSTPCIIINSKSHKLEGTYNDWLSDFTNIQFCNNIAYIETCYSKIKPSEYFPNITLWNGLKDDILFWINV